MFLVDGPGYQLILAHSGWEQVRESLFYWSQPWEQVPGAIRSGDWSFDDLRNFPGNWAIIDVRESDPVLIVDRQRTRQLIYTRAEEKWLITDHIEELRGRIPFAINKEAASLFPHFGYALSNETLLEDVFDCEAGSNVRLAVRPEIKFYGQYTLSEQQIDNTEEYSQSFSRALDTVFERLLARTQGRQLVVPLSAGLDSRLILSWLRRHGVKDVVTFSYGNRNAYERRAAQKVADSLGYPFIFVDQNEKMVRDAWNGSAGEQYVRSGWGGVSLPHKQDWFSIKTLLESGAIKSDAVVVPGHSVPSLTGTTRMNHTIPSFDDVADVLAGRTEQGKPNDVRHHPAFIRSVQRAAEQVNFGSGRNANIGLLQWFNLRERQAKFISNSVRVYEYFGLGWALPLHEPEVWEVRRKAGDRLLLGRTGYRQFVLNTFEDLSGITVSEGERPRRVYDLVQSNLWAKTIGKTRFGWPIAKRLKKWEPRVRKATGTDLSQFGAEGYLPPKRLCERFQDLKSDETRNGRAARLFVADQTGQSLGLFDS